MILIKSGNKQTPDRCSNSESNGKNNLAISTPDHTIHRHLHTLRLPPPTRRRVRWQVQSMWTPPIGTSPFTNLLGGTFSKLRGRWIFTTDSFHSPNMLQIQVIFLLMRCFVFNFHTKLQIRNEMWFL
jgi:hypothetical protein